ncbi:ATP-binding protein, partial [Nonomuraea purpurea]
PAALKGARRVRAGGHWKRTCTSRHLASGLPVLVHTRSGRPGGLVTVEVTAISDALARIEVTDEGAPTVPRPRMPGDDDCHGRGLNIVEYVAMRWGMRPEPLGWMTVWVEVLTTEEAPIPVMDVPLLELEA